jgi:hypothetical protein
VIWPILKVAQLAHYLNKPVIRASKKVNRSGLRAVSGMVSLVSACLCSAKLTEHVTSVLTLPIAPPDTSCNFYIAWLQDE